MNKKLLDVGYTVCGLIGDEINKKSIDCSVFKADDENLISFLRMHNLTTAFVCILEDKNVDFNIGSYNHKSALFKQLKYNVLSDKLNATFSHNHIKHIVLKGKTIQKFYPEHLVRTSTDIDLYIPFDSVVDAVSLMKNDGFSLVVNSDTDLTLQKEPIYNVEFHTDLGGFSDTQKSVMNQLIQNAYIKDEYVGEFCDSDVYIYALNHLYKHFVLSGAGVRMFLDVYLMCKNAQLDFDYINEVLKKLKIDGFNETVLQINEILFEHKKPTPQLEEVIGFVFDSGTFGKLTTFEHLTYLNDSVTDMTKRELSTLHYGVSFKAMSMRYPILKKCPFLYPFSFIYRFVNGMIHKHDLFTRIIKSKKNVSDEKINKYKRIFEIAKIK